VRCPASSTLRRPSSAASGRRMRSGGIVNSTDPRRLSPAPLGWESPCRMMRPSRRDRWFADSPLEEGRFELAVPPRWRAQPARRFSRYLRRRHRRRRCDGS
jgi:hypothetical protein